ncbi:hypothetical protein ACIQ9P_03335 [Kitasatospora sp. NPDC094019]|uniref:hypothetical protein n=1 Tax=Kitasatospora sp. NPDC094019 TaxID=3364091 RepID=UPI00380689CC
MTYTDILGAGGEVRGGEYHRGIHNAGRTGVDPHSMHSENSLVTQESNTSAHQLHLILERVRDSGAENFREAWSSVLGAEYGSGAFAARHAEVCLLLADVTRQIGGLSERSRERLERYVNAWWSAVVQPEFSWGDSARRPAGVLEPSHLDHLESAADIIAATFRGSSAAPTGGGLDQLREQCAHWLGMVEDRDNFELPEALRDTLANQIRHLVWLIDNVALVGVSRVSQEAVSVVGSVAHASHVLRPRDEQSESRWKRSMVSLVAALGLFTTGAVGAREAIEAGDGLVREVVRIVSSEGTGS